MRFRDYQEWKGARLRSRVEVSANGCWIWQGVKTQQGYGLTSWKSKQTTAHRAAWLAFHGPIDGKLDVDHICRQRACLNPDHLRLLTHRENVLAGNGPPALCARKTHCKRGHELTPGNIDARRLARYGQRLCRQCNLESQRARWHARKRR